MCEWLSYGEWCDVKLLCGGRSFNAHRAVLASVSSFLRQILLSCQTDETPTFIVLPEFDIEAMSSVLYYIYNGEVVIQRQKLDMFLDIIRAMQIFIDYQFLGNKLRESVNCDIKFNNCESNMPKNDIFTLGFGDYREQIYVTLRRGSEMKDIPHDSPSNSDPPDKRLPCRNQSERCNSSLGNLKSPYGDRQKNSFLRDLFVETYPRNGNVNGQAGGVLAISNESYRAPASLLLTNANGAHLTTGDILLETYKNTTGFSFHSPTILQPDKQLQCQQNNNKNFREIQPGSFLDAQCIEVCTKEMGDLKPIYDCHPKIYTENPLINDISSQTNLSLLSRGLREQKLPGVSTLDLSIIQSISDPVISSFMSFEDKVPREISSPNCHIPPPSKATINNQVLESPWCPRVPSNFKPFRRKAQDLNYNRLHDQKRSKEDISDSNNNIPNVVQSKLPEVLTANVSKDSFSSAFGSTCIKEEIKCNVCNQVFTSGETLADHMRRHSANARYSCGECGKTFSQLRNFKYHMSIHRGTREFAATCTVCGKYFNDRGYLSSHMKIHRNRKEYKCSTCPKSFNQRVAYNMHVRIHTGVKPHVCEECGKAFSRKMLLKQHQRTHSGERPYACPHCDKRFADRSNMTLHLRLHTGVKPFSCTLCPKSFTKKHHLKSHLNFHTGSKPYSCPRCKLAFTQSSNMRTHLKKCSAPEPTGSSSLQS